MAVTSNFVKWSWDKATDGDLQMLVLDGNRVVGGPVKGEKQNGQIVSAEPMMITARTTSPTIVVYVDGKEYLRHETTVVLGPGDSLSLS